MDKDQRTTPVRIAVAVDERGGWISRGEGWDGKSEDSQRLSEQRWINELKKSMEGNVNVFILTADPVIPEPKRETPEIAATVEEVS